MPDIIMCLLTNLFRIILIDRCVSFFVEEHADGRKRFFVCACFYLINAVTFLAFHTVWINMLCNLAGICAIVWLYTKSVRSILFVSGTVYLVNCGCDVAATSLFVTYRDGESFSQIYSVLSVLLFFICVLLIKKMITTHKSTETVHSFQLLFMPLCSITVIILLIYFGDCSHIGLAIVSVGLLVMNYLMLYLYNQMLLTAAQKYETKLLQTQVSEYANQLKIILRGEEKMKALRHDMKHHLNELTLLANKHEVSEIQDYLDQMKLFVQNQDELIASGNMEIDSVLNYMLQKAKRELETVTIKVALPEKVRHSFDVNVLLGNLLENAIEAARETDNKYLSICVTLKKGVLRIKIENSFLASHLIRKHEPGKIPVLLTSKPSADQHGIGLGNVKKIVEKYNGTMEITTQIDIFCVNLILYMAKMEK